MDLHSSLVAVRSSSCFCPLNRTVRPEQWSLNVGWDTFTTRELKITNLGSLQTLLCNQEHDATKLLRGKCQRRWCCGELTQFWKPVSDCPIPDMTVLGTTGKTVRACCNDIFVMCLCWFCPRTHSPNRQIIDLGYYRSLTVLGMATCRCCSPRQSLIMSPSYSLLAEFGVRTQRGLLLSVRQVVSKISPRDLYLFNFSYPLCKKAVGIICFLYKHKLQISGDFWISMFPFHWCPNRLQGQSQDAVTASVFCKAAWHCSCCSFQRATKVSLQQFSDFQEEGGNGLFYLFRSLGATTYPFNV